MASRHWLLSSLDAAPGVLSVSDSIDLSGDVLDRWKAVSEVNQVDSNVIADAVAAYFDLPRADMDKLELEFARQLPESVARTHQVIPLAIEDQRAMLATIDPTDAATLDELSFTLGVKVEASVATPEEIESALTDVYGEESGELTGWGQVSSSLLASDLILRRKDGAVIQTDTSATSELFTEILRRAVHLGASDIHVQPYGDGAVIRNRVDGVLYRAVELPANVHGHLVRHVKAIAGMDPTKRLVPQDGELRMELEHREIDQRLSVLPVGTGERLVIRLLPQNQVRAMSMLRLEPDELKTMKRLSEHAGGMVLMTGPTGSGKTSLLYAMLAEKNSPELNIMTVEEPVEYQLRGASQIEVDPKTGLTFARALRSILRQDPDVVMVGEIRDEETASIAVQAALTGHFVLSTVHTLDALLATVRMSDLGVSPASLADSLQGVASQRLVRRLCMECREPLEVSDLSQDEKQFSKLWCEPVWKSVGCEQCRSTGFNGRVPVLEIVEIKDELRAALRGSARELESLERMAMEGGTRFLAEGFARRVEEGSTTVSEVLRVYGRGFFSRLQHVSNLRRAAGNPD
jgi:type II secretory ATPase GspE/PulE/Tfp pilus assembly ATPase PilB-like protein